MIRVTIDYVPFGSGRPEQLGVIEIANTVDHPDRPKMGNYMAHFVAMRNGEHVGIHRRFIGDFNRQRWNVFGLLQRAMSALTVNGDDPIELDDRWKYE